MEPPAREEVAFGEWSIPLTPAGLQCPWGGYGAISPLNYPFYLFSGNREQRGEAASFELPPRGRRIVSMLQRCGQGSGWAQAAGV